MYELWAKKRIKDGESNDNTYTINVNWFLYRCLLRNKINGKKKIKI